MKPYFDNGTVRLYQSDARSLPLEPQSVHTVVTSPPYWGLRDYGDDGQLGLEPTVEEYVANMVEVFREVWRVLRDDGTCWLNLGDSYMSTSVGYGNSGGSYEAERDWSDVPRPKRDIPNGLKPKDLVGVPWRVAFALQADGWYLRSDIIWAKPNPMPESVTDRPTKSHEYLFLLTKKPKYYYDAEAVRETALNEGRVVKATGASSKNGQSPDDVNNRNTAVGFTQHDTTVTGRNKRTVWTIPTQSFPDAHFATFPEKLVEPCILAGTSERGVCGECGAPWVRVVETEYDNPGNRTTNGPRSTDNRDITEGFAQRLEKRTTTTGWSPSCEHGPATVPATVLDPFMGSGTVALVAQKLGRRAVGVDLSAQYLDMAAKRLSGVSMPMDMAV